MLANRPRLIIRGYTDGDRIVPGTGQVVASVELLETLLSVLDVDDVAYVHVRCEGNNCYLCRVEVTE